MIAESLVVESGVRARADTFGGQARAQPIVIAGVGSIGRRHMRNLVALGERDVLLHRRRDGGMEPFPVEPDLDVALEAGPRAVIVSNPTALHMSTALRAARAGAHLLIEKPVAHTLDRIEELAAIVEAQRLVVLVGYHLRFHPTLRELRNWVVSGALGRVVSVHAHWGEYLPGWHPDEDYRQSYSARRDLGGGALLTLSHPFDYLRWIAGEVESVFAVSDQLSSLDLDVEDVAQVTVRFTNGALGSVHLDYVQHPPSHYLRITGTRGIALWDAGDGVTRVYDGSRDAWTVHYPPEGFERNHVFLDEMRHFLACIDGLATPECSLADGKRALEIALAAHASAAHDRVIDV